MPLPTYECIDCGCRMKINYDKNIPEFECPYCKEHGKPFEEDEKKS